MKQEIFTAAQLRFHSYFVENEEIQKVMRQASDALEKLATNKTVTVPVKRRGRPKNSAKKGAANLDNALWLDFIGALPSRPGNALLRHYGKRVSSVKEWASKLNSKKLLAIPGMGESSAAKVLEELKARGMTIGG